MSGQADEAVFYICHLYDRGEAQPHLGSFTAGTRSEVIHAVSDALVEHRVHFTHAQLEDALEAWIAGERHFELDEDGASLAFLTVRAPAKPAAAVAAKQAAPRRKSLFFSTKSKH